MDTSVKYPVDTIAIGGKPFLVSTTWTTVEKYSSLTFPLQVRSKASESGKHYGVVNTSTKKATFQYGQYTLLGLEEGQTLCPSLDLLTAKYARDWVRGFFEKKLEKDAWQESDLDSTKLLITTADNTSSSFAPAEFIVSLVSPHGQISEIDAGRESRAFDSMDLSELLETEFQLDDNISIIVIDDDGEAHTLAKTVIDNLGFDADKKLVVITRPTFEKAAQDKDLLPKRIYKPSKIKVRKIGIVAAAVSLAVVGWLGVSYLNQGDAQSYFENGPKWSKLQQQRKDYDDLNEDLSSGSKYWDDRTYRKDVLGTFVNSLSDNLYTSEEIAYILRYINMALPLYSSEWELISLEYRNNNFIATYDRIDKGKGVFFMLDEDILEIDNKDNGIRIEPLSLSEDAETRQYSVIPAITLKRQAEVSQMKKIMRGENAATEILADAAKDASRKAGQMLSYKRAFEGMSFFDKWFLMKGEDTYEQAQRTEYGSLKRALEEVEDATKLFEAQEKLQLKDELIIGNKYDFVTMMQLDSFFEWTFPLATASFPDADAIEEKNKKSKNKKKKDKKKAETLNYGPSIISYSVTISTQESENEEGKVKSYGISDMIRLGQMLNKPFVHVDYVNYDKINEQWEMEVHFFTKTQDYEDKIAKSTNKDV